ncbi:type I restriction endonuclease subunit M [Shewanella sp. YLB-07]|uniref:type I restriction endonuclease subunit M n=1 Tax=Shewanella sp. YLB-07 TaxID=2601268 RepID=UPI00128AE9E7|nr:type I restriction endonuclease subunit M [Shewanella sp. YLB-07]MPY24462.1 type I restriction endonuclease subunit M [Shewanella sp. YLB-07]
MNISNIDNNSMEQCYTSNAGHFDLGVCVVTQGIHQLQKSAIDSDKDLRLFITRHLNGDWGDTPIEDKILNDEATKRGGPNNVILLFNDQVIWIITEADRSVTTILLPSEY